MSEQTQEKPKFMEELDSWTEEVILRPLGAVWMNYSQAADGDAAIQAKARVTDLEAAIKKTMRERVLESYRNGQAAGPRRVYRRQK